MLSEGARAIIVAMRCAPSNKENIPTYSEVAKDVSKLTGERVTRGTAQKVVARVLANKDVNGGAVITPKTLAQAPKPGAPQKLTEREKRRLGRQASRSSAQRRKSWKKIANELDLSFVSPQTISKAFHEQGFSKYVPKEKPFLSPAMKAARLQFVRQQLEGVSQGLHHRILWSDETASTLGPIGKQQVTRQKEEAFDPTCVSKRFKNASLFMFWGSIGWNYKGPCHIFEKKGVKVLEVEKEAIEFQREYRWNQARTDYVEACRKAEEVGEKLPAFKEYNLPTRTEKYAGGVDWFTYVNEVVFPCVRNAMRDFKTACGGDHVVFMQDGAGGHAAEETMRVLAELGIDVLTWPGNSPDLNPIETIWFLIKTRIAEKYGYVSKRADMKEIWLQEWELLELDEINRIIERYVSKLTKVEELNGDNNYEG